MKEHRGRKPLIGLKEVINKKVQEGKSFEDIRKELGLASRQICRYHFITYREMLKNPSKT